MSAYGTVPTVPPSRRRRRRGREAARGGARWSGAAVAAARGEGRAARGRRERRGDGAHGGCRGSACSGSVGPSCKRQAGQPKSSTSCEIPPRARALRGARGRMTMVGEPDLETAPSSPRRRDGRAKRRRTRRAGLTEEAPPQGAMRARGRPGRSARCAAPVRTGATQSVQGCGGAQLRAREAAQSVQGVRWVSKSASTVVTAIAAKERGGAGIFRTVVSAWLQGVRWGAICEHGRQRQYCKECGGASICEHGRRRSQCKGVRWV